MKPPISNLFLDTVRHFSKNKEIVQKIAEILDLIFIDENESRGNVCFSNSSEVRPDFRETFTSLDLQNCMFAILYSSENFNGNSEIPEMDVIFTLLPKNKIKFWELTEKGRELIGTSLQ